MHQLTLLVFILLQPRCNKLDCLRESVPSINAHVKIIHPLITDGVERFEFLSVTYVDSVYREDYEVGSTMLDCLLERVSEFQARVLAEYLKVTDGFVLDKKHSNGYKQPGELFSLVRIKAEKLPLAVITEQKAAIKGVEEAWNNEKIKVEYFGM